MKVLYGFIAAALLVTACDKEDFQTKPKIEIKSVTPDVVPVGGSLQVRLEFTDKEGDVDDSITVIRTRLNIREFDPKPYTLKFKIPTFPDKTRGEMDVTMLWATALTLQNPPLRIPGTNTFERDTLQLAFSVLDAAGNRSDTVQLASSVIVVR